MALRDDWPVLGLQSRFIDEHASKLLNDVEQLQRLAEGLPTRTFTLSQLKPFLASKKSLLHKGEKHLLFNRTINSSKIVFNFKGPIWEYVKTLDLSTWPYNIAENVTEKLLRRVEGGLESFVAPTTTISVKGLTALSKCRKLVRLDLSHTKGFFRIPDFLLAVSTLSCLETFYFPLMSPAPMDWGWNDDRQNQATPNWPDSLETFYIPTALGRGYLQAFENAPSSLKSLTVKGGAQTSSYQMDVLDTVFRLIGSRILTLKVNYEDERTDQLTRTLLKFPNILHIIVCSPLLWDFARRDTDLKIVYPLRPVTLILERVEDLYDLHFLGCLETLLNKSWLPNIRSLRLCSQHSMYRLVSTLQDIPLPVTDIELLRLFDLSKRMKRRSSSANGLTESGIWVVDGRDNDSIVGEFTEEDIARIASGAAVRYILVSEEVDSDGSKVQSRTE